MIWALGTELSSMDQVTRQILFVNWLPKVSPCQAFEHNLDQVILGWPVFKGKSDILLIRVSEFIRVCFI